MSYVINLVPWGTLNIWTVVHRTAETKVLGEAHTAASRSCGPDQ